MTVPESAAVIVACTALLIVVGWILEVLEFTQDFFRQAASRATTQ